MVRIARPELGTWCSCSNLQCDTLTIMSLAVWSVHTRLPRRPQSRKPFTPGSLSASLLVSASFWPWPPCLHRRIQPSSWCKLSPNHAPFRLNRFHNIFQNLVHRIFIENSQSSVRQQVHFQRLQLDTRFSRHIFDRQSAKVRQPRFGTYRGVLGVSRRNYVSRILIRPCIQLRQPVFYSRPGVLVGVISHDFSCKLF